MAECSIETLRTDACANDFFKVAENDVVWRAVVLQLLYSISGGAETLAQLEQQACDNGFMSVAQNEQQWKSVVLQLLCNTSAG